MSVSSNPKARTQVLVVGAGPVGLVAALRLREQGIDVRIVDQQSEHSAQTFPVVLHPMTLRVLRALGLTEALFWRGRPVSQLAIYTECERRAVLDLPKADGIAPGALTLPQDILRKALTNALATRGVQIEWNTQLARLAQDERGVRGWLVSTGPSSTRRLTKQELGTFEADFVIGADGSRFDGALGARHRARGSRPAAELRVLRCSDAARWR